ncbi:hypothetical protein MACH26_11440 [Planctobacterium marinum]|uniref:Dienelactone hydrolase domain-containing protein n=2 Tax=Planctobacterium marinum TaxID=1631968 RepID=A0AA48HTM3_9ALTE|nr:hypothetical protein MACH26_11440 [Planctobacterium marinum]
MLRKLFMMSVLIPGLAFAGWQSSDKKTADETVAILTSNDEVMNAYLWLPEGYDANNQYSAVVMVHGCGGAHYKDTADQWTAKYVSGKYKVWGKLLNEQNTIALLVDSFTHRDNNGDVGGGVCGGDPLERPTKIDPISVRPTDIAEGIAWLKSRDDINPDKIGVLGFSNGGTSALAFANHGMLASNEEQLQMDDKQWFNLPFDAQYQASTVISLYPGCALNGYSDATQDIFDDAFETNSESYIFAASDDDSLPDDTLEKCHNLALLDAGNGWETPNLQLNVVADTDHQFDYKENDEAPVEQTIARILALFGSM